MYAHSSPPHFLDKEGFKGKETINFSQHLFVGFFFQLLGTRSCARREGWGQKKEGDRKQN